MIKRLALGSAAAIGICIAAAWAIQPGTTGTEKQWQQSGFRTGVLIQKNNTATSSAAAVTLNAAGSGVITTEALTTLAGSDYTLTLTNNMIAAADIVLATVNNGTNTGGAPNLRAITPAAGSVAIVVRNGQTVIDTALNGTLQIRFVVVKQSANGSD